VMSGGPGLSSFMLTGAKGPGKSALLR